MFDLCMAGPPAPVLDTGEGSLGPGLPQHGIAPEPNQNPGHFHSHSLSGNDSKWSILSGSTPLQDKEEMVMENLQFQQEMMSLILIKATSF